VTRFSSPPINWNRSLPTKVGAAVFLSVLGGWFLWASWEPFPLAKVASWALAVSLLTGMTAAWICSRALDSIRLAWVLLSCLDQESSFTGGLAAKVSALTQLDDQDDCAQFVRLTSRLLVRYGDRLQFLERQRLALESWLHEHRDRLILMEAEQEKLQVALAQAQDRIRQLEGVDLETGLANHHRFYEALQHTWQQALRSEQVLSIVACEVDHLADWVNLQGEAFGQQTIHNLATVLKQQVQRSSDVVGRDRGDRFLILLPNTDSIGALAVAESIRHQFNRCTTQQAMTPTAHHWPSHYDEAPASPWAAGSSLHLDMDFPPTRDRPRNNSNTANDRVHAGQEASRPINTNINVGNVSNVGIDASADLADAFLVTGSEAAMAAEVAPEVSSEVPDGAPMDRSPSAQEPIPIAGGEVTLSLGIGTLVPDLQQLPDAAVRSALRALERARRHGGNCVEMDGLEY